MKISEMKLKIILHEGALYEICQEDDDGFVSLAETYNEEFAQVIALLPRMIRELKSAEKWFTMMSKAPYSGQDVPEQLLADIRALLNEQGE